MIDNKFLHVAIIIVLVALAAGADFLLAAVVNCWLLYAIPVCYASCIFGVPGGLVCSFIALVSLGLQQSFLGVRGFSGIIAPLSEMIALCVMTVAFFIAPEIARIIRRSSQE